MANGAPASDEAPRPLPPARETAIGLVIGLAVGLVVWILILELVGGVTHHLSLAP